MKSLENKETKAEGLWQEYLKNLAILISNLRMAYDMDIILGGEVGGYLSEYMIPLGEKVMEYNLLYMKDRSLETGAKGIAAYAHSRLSVSLQGELPFEESYRQTLYETYPDVCPEQEIWEGIIGHNIKAESLSWKAGLGILLKDI